MKIPFLLALIVAGLAGNYFRFPIFLNIDFLFGSIFAMLTLQFFGLGRGILAALIIAGYTYTLWNHPYAIIIMTIEVATVGWLMGRRKIKIGMVLADTLYWLIIGMPLVYLFYHVVMHAPPSSTYITMTKQATNGIANALVARLVFTGFALRSRSSLISYREISYNLLGFFVLCPGLIMLAIGSRNDFAETDQNIRRSLDHHSQRVTRFLGTWLDDRRTAILNLGEMAATRSPQQMQTYLELAKKSDVHLQRVGLLDREATTTAFFPLTDELGQSAIGRSYADRPFLPELKRTLKPMLSEVGMAKFGIPKPRVLMLAPVVIRGEFGGYVAGTLDLEQVRRDLDECVDLTTLLYTLIDKNGNVIMSSRTDQKALTPFVRGNGTLNRIDTGTGQWVPTLPPNTPASERWKNSFYVAESGIGSGAEWKLVLEQPVAPFQKTLYDRYTGKLTLLFLILLGALALAELLSRRLIVTLEVLGRITRDLPAKIASGAKIDWPESGVQESNNLISNFQEMSATFQRHVMELKLLNDSLEHRTQQIYSANLERNKLFNAIEQSNESIVITDLSGTIQYVNPAFTRVTGYSREEAIGGNPRILNSGLTPENVFDDLWKTITSGRSWKGTLINKNKSGELYYEDASIAPVFDEQGNITNFVATKADVTDRITAEKELQNKNDELVMARDAAEASNRAKSDFLATMSHELKTPLNAIIGFSELLEDGIAGPLADNQKDLVKDICSSGRHLLSMINDILDLSKADAGKMELELSGFSLEELVDGTLVMFREKAMKHTIKVTAEVEEEIDEIIADKGKIKLILFNLLSNAVKFTPDGGSVCVQARRVTGRGDPVGRPVAITDQTKDGRPTGSPLQNDENLIEISVTDTGIGISAEDQKRLFHPFQQVESAYTRKYSGTGLSLSLCKKIVELHGGKIWAESESGKGSRFVFVIPVYSANGGIYE